MLDVMLEEFPFASLWNTGIFLFLAFFAIVYIFILPTGKNHSIWKSILFYIGLIIVFAAAGSPLNIIGRIEFSSHIVQIVLLCLIAPPLLIIGMKREILVRAQKNQLLANVMKFITKPYITIGLFFLILYTYHHPPIFDEARVDLYGNYLYIVGLFFTSILLWIPILSRKGNKKFHTIYHLICIVLSIPLGILLLTSQDILYHAYTDLTTFTEAIQVCLPPGRTISPEIVLLLLPFEPVAEQHQGGIIWLTATTIIFIVTFLFKKRLQIKG